MIELAAGLDGATITTGVLSGTNSGVLSGAQGLLLFALVWIVAGVVVLLTVAREPIRRAWRYIRMDAFDPETATDDGSLVAVSGTVVESDGTVTGPMSDEACVAYEWKDQVLRDEYRYDHSERRRQERSSRYDDDDEINERVLRWKTVSEESDTRPFEVDTEHGRVAVDPEQADLSLPKQAKDNPSLLARIASRTYIGEISLGFLLSHRLITQLTRSFETHLKPGSNVVVIGEVSEHSQPGEPIAAVGAGSADVFELTIRSPRRLAIQSSLKAMFSSIPAMICFLLGFGILIGGLLTGAFW